MNADDLRWSTDPELMRDLRDASPGPCDEAVVYLIRRWRPIPPASLSADLREAGAWDDIGADEDTDLARWVWLVACDRRDEGSL